MKRFFVGAGLVVTMAALPVPFVMAKGQAETQESPSKLKSLFRPFAAKSDEATQPPKAPSAPRDGAKGLLGKQEGTPSLSRCPVPFGLVAPTELIRRRIMPAVLAVATETIISQEGFGAPPELKGSPFEDLFRFFEPHRRPTQRRVKGMGSAFVFAVDPDKGPLILTNHHVIEDANVIQVKAHDGRVYPAEVLGADQRTDIAVLRLKSKDNNGVKTNHANRAWPILPLATVPAEVGNYIITAGSPLGLEFTFSAGHVSSDKQRTDVSPTGRERMDNYYTQISAPISPGNSGGPSVRVGMDANCRPRLDVIGVNAAIAPHGQNVGFTIPATQVVNPVVQQILEHGRVTRSWLGVEVMPVKWEVAQSMGLDRPQGALIHKVVADSPARKSRLAAGDVIVEFDGEPVQNSGSLPIMAGLKGAGKTVRVKVFNQDANQNKRRKCERAPGEDKRTCTLRVTLEKRPDEEGPETTTAAELKDSVEIETLGVAVATLDDTGRKKLALGKNTEGARIVSVTPGGAGYRTGIQPHDVVIKVNGKKIANAQVLKHLIGKVKTGEIMQIFLLRPGDKVLRKGSDTARRAPASTLFVALPKPPPPAKQQGGANKRSKSRKR
ncbi:MAG: trypsin-like peptidase domain-containing protein [Myxococcota bacterium]